MNDLYNPMLDDDEEDYYIQSGDLEDTIQESNDDYIQDDDVWIVDGIEFVGEDQVNSDDLYNPMLDDDDDEIVSKVNVNKVVDNSRHGINNNTKNIDKTVDTNGSKSINNPVENFNHEVVDIEKEVVDKAVSNVSQENFEQDTDLYNPMLDDEDEDVILKNTEKKSVNTSNPIVNTSNPMSVKNVFVESEIANTDKYNQDVEKEKEVGREEKERKKNLFVKDIDVNDIDSESRNNVKITDNLKITDNQTVASNVSSVASNFKVERMRSDGTFRSGRVVEAGDWNKFTVNGDSAGLGYSDLDSDVYSGGGVDRSLGVPVDGNSGGVGERYVDRAKFKKKISKPKRHESLDSDFNFSVSSVVDVDSVSGLPVGAESSFINKYSNNDEDLKNRNNGDLSEKINNRELSFFKNLGYGKKEFFDSGSLLSVANVDLASVDDEVLSKSKKRIDRALGGAKGLKSKSKFSFSSRDGEILSFLAMFKYANAQQLARMFSTSANSVRNNLRRLESSGLVVREKVVNTSALWFLTEAGLLLSGFDLPRTTRSKVNWSMFPHQFTVNYVAANLWGANLNVLNLDNFPSKNRMDIKGNLVYGEELISELAIQSSFGKFKIGSRADIYRPQLLSKITSDFDDWKISGGIGFGPSPEFFEGNEWMWVLLDTGSDLNYHVPDLVVKRERNVDGSPASIAVEVELMNKDWDSYLRTLTAYHNDTRFYDKVVWVCKGIGTAEKLEKVAKTIGLWQSGRISIVPILTEEGVFKGDLWTI